MNLKKLNAHLALKDKTINDIARHLGLSAASCYDRCRNDTWRENEIEAIARYLNLKPGNILSVFFDKFCGEYDEAHKR